MVDKRGTLLERLTGATPASTDRGVVELPADAPRGREARDLLAAETLEAARIAAQQSTELAARLQGFLSDGLLGIGTNIFDAAATPVSLQFKAEIGTLIVRNLSSTNTVFVTVGGASAAAPLSGRGVWRIPPGVRESVAIGNTQATLYGVAGDVVEWQAFTAGPRPVT
jgi:hypothetical protein